MDRVVVDVCTMLPILSSAMRPNTFDFFSAVTDEVLELSLLISLNVSICEIAELTLAKEFTLLYSLSDSYKYEFPYVDVFSLWWIYTL